MKDVQVYLIFMQKLTIVEFKQRRRSEIILLVSLGILIHLPFLIWDLIFQGNNPLFKGWDNGDLRAYKARAQAILDGEFFNTVVWINPNQFIPGFGAAPLINYLFVPLAPFSFTPFAFECYFVLWNILTTILIAEILRIHGFPLKKRLLGALFYLFNPIVILNATWILTDESITVFFIILPFYLQKKGIRWAIGSLIIGFYVKFLSIILLPIFLIEAARCDASIIQESFFALLLLVLIGTPFFLTTLESNTLQLPKSWSTGNDQSEGYAPIRIFLKTFDYPVYGYIKFSFLLLFLLGLMIFLKISWRHNLNILVMSGFTVLLWFFMTWHWFLEYFAYILPFFALIFLNRSNNSPNHPSPLFPADFTFRHFLLLFLLSEGLLFLSQWAVWNIGYEIPLLIITLGGFSLLTYTWLELVSCFFFNNSSETQNK